MKKPDSNKLPVVLLTAFASLAQGAVITWYGPSGGAVVGWDAGTDSIAWAPVPSLNSPVNSGIPGALDFVGDSANPGFYIAQNTSFLFFRMRVRVATAGPATFSGAHAVLIDVVGWNYPGKGQTGKPDFAFSWDSKSADPTSHGLEMQLPDALGTKWSEVKMDDIDLNNAKKFAPPDINTTGQGYVRTVDDQPTANFGTTTFIDFAVAISYLQSDPNLSQILANPLRFQLGSIANATDHNYLNADIGGGFTLDSEVASSWSATIPEPPAWALFWFAAAFICARGWRQRRRSCGG